MGKVIERHEIPEQRAGLLPALTIAEAVARYNAVIEFTKTVM